jgi:hypothetical protein
MATAFARRQKSPRAGWPWRLPARAPTDPDVRALAHPVLQPTGSPSMIGPRGYSTKLREHAVEPQCAQHVSLGRVCRPTLRFPPQDPPGRVPLLNPWSAFAMGKGNFRAGKRRLKHGRSGQPKSFRPTCNRRRPACHAPPPFFPCGGCNHSLRRAPSAAFVCTFRRCKPPKNGVSHLFRRT